MSPMRNLSTRLARIPQGAALLFFIQIFATLGYAVLYSSLVLYATEQLRFSAGQATLVMGLFGAFNYGLHLVGGYLGGRLLSNRNLFLGGMVLQLAGCAVIAGGGVAALYLGLALFLTGSGLNVTCLNMMLTQRFAPEDQRREGAFLWNYAGMNIGFFVGFAVAGHYQLGQRYQELFWFATVGNALAILLTLAYWRRLADLDTPLLRVGVGGGRPPPGRGGVVGGGKGAPRWVCCCWSASCPCSGCCCSGRATRRSR
jgi:POT family proton-dependent oligopeptide transporter